MKCFGTSIEWLCDNKGFRVLVWTMRCMVKINVVPINGLGFTMHVSVNPIMKFIYTLCKCIISIYVYVCANVEHATYKCKLV
jgi:hypothetical protein